MEYRNNATFCAIGSALHIYKSLTTRAAVSCYRRFSPLESRSEAHCLLLQDLRFRAGWNNKFHVQRTFRFSLQRHRYRPRYRQHAGLRKRPGHRPARAIGGGRTSRHQQSARGRRRSEANARTHSVEHCGGAAVERRRDRGLRSDRSDAASLHHQGAQPPGAGATARGDRGSFRNHRSGEARGARIGHSRRRARSLFDRRTDGRGDRCRACRCRIRPAT